MPDSSRLTHAAVAHALAPNRRMFGLGLAATLVALPSGAIAQEQAAQEQEQTAPAPAPVHESGAGNATGEPTPQPTRLRAAPGQLQLKPEPEPRTAVLGFNGHTPGPVLRVRQGDVLAVDVENQLSEPLSLHWQGAGAPNSLDGVAGLTGPAIAPGATQNISFPANRAGLFWYRPMTIGSVARQTESGLYGVLIVEETNPPAVEKDLVLVLDDWALDPSAQLRPDFDTIAARAGSGRLGNWLTLNAKAPPERTDVSPGGRVRLRILNAANARPVPLHFSGLTAHVIGVDGRPSEIFQPARDSLTLMPGGRYDVIVDAPGHAGAAGVLSASLGAGIPLLVVTATGAAAAQPLAELQMLPAPDLPHAIRLQDSTHATLTLAGGLKLGADAPASGLTDPDRIWTINNVAWPEAVQKPLLTVKSGKPVTLELKNNTALMQTLHIHGHHVRRLHNLDDGWDPYWLDVVAIPAGQAVLIAFIAGEPGKWMIGSSNAERLDGGMAAWFQVTP